MTLLVAEQLSKVFYSPNPRTVLKDVNLTVHAGETIAITGSSGEGKSTLLHILGTLEPPTSGRVCYQGVSDLNFIRNQQVGFIFQAFHLLEDYTVLENVLMPAMIAGKAKQQTPRALALLKKMGLEPLKHQPTHLLSGGEKQRVAIARALCNDPPLIMADEPTGNLDYATSQEIHKLLFALVREEKKALLLVTHDQEWAQTCERIFLLTEGKLCVL